MAKGNLANFAHDIKLSLTRHAPEILMGLGITGMFVTTIMAVKVTPKAVMLIEQRKQELGVEKLKALDTVKTTYKCYLPAAAVATVSTGCLIGSSSTSIRRHAALATAYQMVKTGYDEYREKVVETIGEKKEAEVKEKVLKDKLDANPSNTKEIIFTGNGDTLCYDDVSGRYFKTDINVIKKAVNDMNYKMRLDNYVSLNEFYQAVGLDPIKIGYYIGWNIDRGQIELDPHSMLTKDDKPCYVVSFYNMPEHDYQKLY